MNRPRIPRRAAIGAVMLGSAAAGAAAGVLWAQIAPPIHGVVALTRGGERVQAFLGDEADRFFVAPFLMLGLVTVVGLVTAALAWQWQAHRGPGMVAGLSAGLVAAAALGTLGGAWLVHRRYPPVDVDTAPVTPESRVYYFAEAPPAFFGHTALQVAATILVPAGAAALAYALCATWTARDDLGGYPPVEPANSAPGLTSGGGPPPGR